MKEMALSIGFLLCAILSAVGYLVDGNGLYLITIWMMLSRN
jgi:hypothetical protein